MLRLLIPSLALLATNLCPAQADVVRSAAGVQTVDGIVHAIGPNYGARFTAQGIVFTPVLGAATPTAMPVRYSWTEVWRGDCELLRRQRDPAPEVQGDQVRYRHSAALHEVYDVRRDGIEQSFVFAEKPVGRGDLLVRGELITELTAGAADAHGVTFALPSGGGVSFGAVTGVDARGSTCAGSLRLNGTTLELSLPAAFVEAAQYPLVLDPLIGAVIPIADTAGVPDRSPAIAYDEATTRYLVAWTVQYSASMHEVRGQIVLSNGSVFGAPIVLSSTGVDTVIDRGGVANVRDTGRFVVAMRIIGTSNGLSVRSMQAGNWALGPITPLIANGNENVLMASVGGDSRIGSTNVLVAYTSLLMSNGQRVPYTTMLTMSPTGTFTTVLAANAMAANSINNPEVAVSQHGGLLGKWLVAWTDQTGSGTMRRINARVIDTAGTSCSTVQNIELTNSGAEVVSEVACATRDGALGLITWTYSFGNTRAVHAKAVVALGTCGAMTVTPGNPVVLPAGTGLRDRPAVDFAADKFVLAFRERTAVGGTARTVVLGLDQNSGTPGGAEHYPSGWLPIDAEPAVGSRWSGGGTSDQALVAWSDDSTIQGHRFEATGGGTVAAAGGGCGYSSLSADSNTYSGLPTLGQSFSFEIAAPTFPVLALVVGFAPTQFVCGPCTLIASPDLLVPGGGPVPVQVPNKPNLIGAELYSQWLQLRPSGCTLLPDFGFSNALKFTIAE